MPGQYIGVEIQPPEEEYKEIRQYSLSGHSQPDHYRISVKREIEGKPGVVSNYLHDSLRLGDEVTMYPPVGDFYLKPNNAPVVLISAGVGLTPMQAMLETLIAEQDDRQIVYLHACENKAQHSFEKRNRGLADHHGIEYHVWYKSEDSSGAHHGHMDLAAIKQQLPLHSGEYYLCGPTAFMQFAKQQLLALGVAQDRIHYEVFGPHEAF